jgi:hypothetical protein
MTRTAALELGRRGIRVNSIHPGVIETPLVRTAPPETLARLHFDSETGMPQYDPVARRVYVNLQDQNIFAVADLAFHKRIVRSAAKDALKPNHAEFTMPGSQLDKTATAQSWLARFPMFDWIGGRHEGWSATYQDHYLEPERWAHYMSQPRGVAVSSRLRDGDWMRRALAALGDYHRQWPVCLCHGDTHLGNLYEEQKVFSVIVKGAAATRSSLDSVRNLIIDTPTGHAPRCDTTTGAEHSDGTPGRAWRGKRSATSREG